MRQDYLDEMETCIRDYISLNVCRDDWTDDRGGLEEKLNNDLWSEDGVTGNSSGSFYFNANTAKDTVLDNMDLLKEAYEDFRSSPEEVENDFLNEDWEKMDVTIRCYLLSEVILKMLDDLEDSGYFNEEESV